MRPRALLGAPADLSDPALYFNRELSWLDFNWRVLHQAVDPRVPLLERVRFLSITQSNLDEFVRKRVGGLKRQREAGVRELSPDGRTPDEQLALIREAILPMQAAMSETWSGALVPALGREGIRIRSWRELDPEQRLRLRRHFLETLLPVLTPLAVEPGHPVPFISNQSLSLAVLLDQPRRGGIRFARLEIPLERGRWIPLDAAGEFLALEELVACHLTELFPRTRVLAAHAFRITRNADVRRDEEEADDLLEMISDELRERRFAPVVRLEIDADASQSVLSLLEDELRIEKVDVYRVRGLIDFTTLEPIASLDRPALRFDPWEPVVPPELATEGEGDGPPIFERLRERDILVHHPYDSFADSVQRFVEEAADDPHVMAIKLTLYRTSEDSPIVRALARAAQAGKRVAVLVEVTARFDEAINIEWGQMLERAGVHVTYGLLGLKTHTKVTLVVRQEDDGVRLYSHVGTGNYHATTARLYSDLGLLTADPDVGADLAGLFDHLTGQAPEPRYRAMVVAPRDLRGVLERLVDREIEHARGGGEGRIILKMNALDDTGLIRALYRAARAGVRADLIVRGHTRLRPGVPGVSDRIRVISIVGRFLEHDRIFFFGNGGDHDVLIGSADWRHRNLEERVEAVVRVRDPDLRARLHRILVLALEDNRLAWELDAAGRYALRTPLAGSPVRSLHRRLMDEARARGVRRDPPRMPTAVLPE